MGSSGEFFTRSRAGCFDVYLKTSSTLRNHVLLGLIMFWWWRHNSLLNIGDDVAINCATIMWLCICDASTWKVVSNSMNIDFIHDDLHDWSYKKQRYHVLIIFLSEKCVD